MSVGLDVDLDEIAERRRPTVREQNTRGTESRGIEPTRSGATAKLKHASAADGISVVREEVTHGHGGRPNLSADSGRLLVVFVAGVKVAHVLFELLPQRRVIVLVRVAAGLPYAVVTQADTFALARSELLPPPPASAEPRSPSARLRFLSRGASADAASTLSPGRFRDFPTSFLCDLVVPNSTCASHSASNVSMKPSSERGT